MNSSNTAGPEANSNLNDRQAPYLRSKEHWLEDQEKHQQKLSTTRADKFSDLFENFFLGVPSFAEAQEAIATALFIELESAAWRKFQQVGRTARVATAGDYLAQESNLYASELTETLLAKLDAGEFSSSQKLQTYVGGIIKKMLSEAFRRLKKFQGGRVQLFVEGFDEDGVEGVYENADCISEGMPLANRTVDFYQLNMLDALSREDAEFLAAYELAECEIEKTAEILGIAPATARQRFHRLCVRLQTAELTEYLVDQFGADQKRVKAMAAAILPLIKRMMQRATVDYPKSWEEALSLPAIPKVRRVDDDKPKSRWIQAVRSLYRLWESQFQTQRQPHQKAPASPSCRLQSL